LSEFDIDSINKTIEKLYLLFDEKSTAK